MIVAPPHTSLAQERRRAGEGRGDGEECIKAQDPALRLPRDEVSLKMRSSGSRSKHVSFRPDSGLLGGPALPARFDPLPTFGPAFGARAPRLSRMGLCVSTASPGRALEATATSTLAGSIGRSSKKAVGKNADGRAKPGHAVSK